MNEPQSEYLPQDKPPQLTSVITIGALTIDLSLCDVSIDGQPVMLGAQDYKALVYLAAMPGASSPKMSCGARYGDVPNAARKTNSQAALGVSG
jgi:hypothetical protein